MAVAVFAGMGDTVAGTLRDHLVDPDTPVEVRRDLQRSCRRLARQRHSSSWSRAFDGDTVGRHRIITALNKLGQCFLIAASIDG